MLAESDGGNARIPPSSQGKANEAILQSDEFKQMRIGRLFPLSPKRRMGNGVEEAYIGRRKIMPFHYSQGDRCMNLFGYPRVNGEDGLKERIGGSGGFGADRHREILRGIIEVLTDIRGPRGGSNKQCPIEAVLKARRNHKEAPVAATATAPIAAFGHWLAV